MSSETWIGCLIDVDCGEIGCFQGRVSSVDAKQGHVRLKNATLDGEFLPCDEVTIKTGEIKDLKIISFEPVETKVNNEDENGSEKQKENQASMSKKGQLSKEVSTPDQKKSNNRSLKSKSRKKQRNEECFSIQLDDVMIPNFDFEKNLKLFDKEAEFEKLEAKGKLHGVINLERKLNYDENVLETEPVSIKQIVAPVGHTGCEYHTDLGVMVPAISMVLKNQLIKTSETMGLTAEQRNENAGMCTCQMALQLLGGENRLTQRNAHQLPHVIVMAGSNVVGIQAICAARHLANHKVHVTLFVPIKTEKLVPHLALFYHTGCKIVSDVSGLPTEPVDLLIHGLIGHEEEPASEVSKIIPLTRWANNNKAPILIIDPCSQIKMFGVEPKWSLSFGLPLIDVPNNCRMYLADVGIPKGVFSSVNIKYTSPFGNKYVIALND